MLRRGWGWGFRAGTEMLLRVQMMQEAQRAEMRRVSPLQGESTMRRC